MQDINKQEATVNGVKVTDLSESGQKLFDKIVALKKEADQLASSFQIEQASAVKFKQLAQAHDLELKEGQTLPQFFAEMAEAAEKVAKEHYSKHEAKNGALKELSDMILEEVNEIKKDEMVEGELEQPETASESE